jgi:hypothetical protein
VNGSRDCARLVSCYGRGDLASAQKSTLPMGGRLISIETAARLDAEKSLRCPPLQIFDPPADIVIVQGLGPIATISTMVSRRIWSNIANGPIGILHIPIQLPVKTHVGPSESVNQWSLKGTSIAAKTIRPGGQTNALCCGFSQMKTPFLLGNLLSTHGRR